MGEGIIRGMSTVLGVMDMFIFTIMITFQVFYLKFILCQVYINKAAFTNHIHIKNESFT